MILVDVVRAIQAFFKNMSLYPGLFSLLDKTVNRVLESDAEQIISIISRPMAPDDVDRIMVIIHPYLDEPITA